MVEDLTEDNVIALAVRLQIERLFASARECQGDECSAYLMHGAGDDQRFCVYLSFRNGYQIGETELHFMPDELPKDWMTSPIDEAAARAVETCRELFPNAANEQLIWRAPPFVERHAAQKASRKFKFAAQPAHTMLYFRCINTPLGV